MDLENSRGLSFSKATINIAINHLIGNCYFNVENVTIKNTISISMEIEPAPFGQKHFYTTMKKNRFRHQFLLIKSA